MTETINPNIEFVRK